MNNSQRGITLLVPVCLLLTLVTTAVWTFSKQLRHYAVTQQGETKREMFQHQAAESLALTHHALTMPVYWKRALSTMQQSLISEHQRINIRGTTMNFFTLSATSGSESSAVSYTEAMRIVRHPVIVARPSVPATFAASVNTEADITLFTPASSKSVYRAQYPLAQASSIQQHCVSSIKTVCQPLSNSTGIFHDDIFQYTFGIKQDDFDAAAFPGSEQLSECSNITAVDSNIIWVSGNCDIPGAAKLGSNTHPMIVVVEDGHIRFGAGSSLTGLLVTLPRASRLPKDIILHDSSVISGAAIIAQPLSSLSVLRINYSQEILETLQNAHYTQRATFLSGSWHDF